MLVIFIVVGRHVLLLTDVIVIPVPVFVLSYINLLMAPTEWTDVSTPISNK